MTFIESLRQRYIGRAQTGYARAGQRLEERLRTTSPYRTGNMSNRTRVIPRGPLRLQTLVDTPYASYVREGTRPHDIFPVRAQILRFIINGKVIFSRHVRHPGTRPNGWYDLAMAERPRIIENELKLIPL